MNDGSGGGGTDGGAGGEGGEGGGSGGLGGGGLMSLVAIAWAYEARCAMPHIFLPRTRRTKPFSPHVAPQLFLTLQ